MSGTLPANEPACIDDPSRTVDQRIDARPRMIGDFEVRRVLPSVARRTVGPVIFFDHMGPTALPPGRGIDVAPHPHIGLATLTYLFEGELVHRDALGSERTIRPGDVNWMLAGRGLAHSERSTPAAREQGARIHGIQTWIATPRDQEDAAPHFEHHAAAAIPSVAAGGATLDVIAGEAFGVRSPVSVLSPTLYVHARLAKGARLELDTAHEERAIYVVEGEVQCDGRVFRPGTMVVLRPGVAATVSAVDSARAMIVGGAKLDGPRHIFWNFVASDKERIERAKSDWREGRFAKVIGDELDFVPLPE